MEWLTRTALEEEFTNIDYLIVVFTRTKKYDEKIDPGFKL